MEIILLDSSKFANKNLQIVKIPLKRIIQTVDRPIKKWFSVTNSFTSIFAPSK